MTNLHILSQQISTIVHFFTYISSGEFVFRHQSEYCFQCLALTLTEQLECGPWPKRGRAGKSLHKCSKASTLGLSWENQCLQVNHK